jgi:hypothetical protein
LPIPIDKAELWGGEGECLHQRDAPFRRRVSVEPAGASSCDPPIKLAKPGVLNRDGQLVRPELFALEDRSAGGIAAELEEVGGGSWDLFPRELDSRALHGLSICWPAEVGGRQQGFRGGRRLGRENRASGSLRQLDLLARREQLGTPSVSHELCLAALVDSGSGVEPCLRTGLRADAGIPQNDLDGARTGPPALRPCRFQLGLSNEHFDFPFRRSRLLRPLLAQKDQRILDERQLTAVSELEPCRAFSKRPEAVLFEEEVARTRCQPRNRGWAIFHPAFRLEELRSVAWLTLLAEDHAQSLPWVNPVAVSKLRVQLLELRPKLGVSEETGRKVPEGFPGADDVIPATRIGLGGENEGSDPHAARGSQKAQEILLLTPSGSSSGKADRPRFHRQAPLTRHPPSFFESF